MAFRKSIHINLFILVILMPVLLPTLISAKIFILTEITAGRVISITKEQVIELDDGFLYYPAKKNIPISINPGETTSIRYYIDDKYKRKYIDAEKGENSLKDVPVPASTTKPKKQL